MYIIANAFQNLGRNKGRNLLMGVIIFAIITTGAVSLIINSTTRTVIDDYKNRFGSRVIISQDMEKIMRQSSLEGIDVITIEQHMAFAGSKYLKESMFACEMPSVSETLQAVGENDTGMGGSVSVGGEREIEMPRLKIKGNSYTSNLPDFLSGERQIAEGKMYAENGECIISRELAELNGISVGDIIEVKSNQKSVAEPLTLTVSGIYHDATSEYGNIPFRDAYMNRRNEIYTNFETLLENPKAKGSFFDISATYYLKSPDDLRAFEAELRDMGLSEYYKVSTDEAQYQSIVGPIEGLQGISISFLVVIFALGCVILVLLSTIATRERKYEIGVLRAMGLKKRMVAAGLLSEMLILTGICLLVGLGVGTAVAKPVADTILAQQIEVSEGGYSNTGGNGINILGGGGGVSIGDEETLAEVEIKLTGEAIVQIIGLSILLASVASVVSISFITRYEPMKILMERN